MLVVFDCRLNELRCQTTASFFPFFCRRCIECRFADLSPCKRSETSALALLCCNCSSKDRVIKRDGLHSVVCNFSDEHQTVVDALPERGPVGYSDYVKSENWRLNGFLAAL